MATNHRKLKFSIDDVKRVVKKYLYLTDDLVLDVIFAAHLANWMDADPVWLIVIAPPSSAKTEILRAFDGRNDFYFLSSMTPTTFISGIKTKGGESPKSLLPKIDKKTLVFKDFTTILSMRSEQQAEILAQLREVYDGHYSKAFGTGVTFNWHGKVGFIAACTNIYDRHYGVIGSMGDRFLLYRNDQSEAEATGLLAQKNVGNEQVIREEIRDAVNQFLDQFQNGACVKRPEDDTINHQLVSLACFCAAARCPVERNWRSKSIDYDPVPEGPGRIVKQLTQIGMGLAMVRGQETFDLSIYETIKKIGRDLVPANRLAILRHLWDKRVFEERSKWFRTGDVAEAVGKPGTTVKMTLEDMMVVGMLNRRRDGSADNSPYEWQINKIAFRYMARAEVFEKSL